MPSAHTIVVGFDAYLDEFVSPGMTPNLTGMGALFTRASRDGSLARELHRWEVRPGGNSVNLASGLAASDADVHLFANLADPSDPTRLHAAFAPVAHACASAISLGPCARTLCFEGAEGKLMLNHSAPLGVIDRELAESVLLADAPGSFASRCASADAIAICNWAKTPHLTGAWRLLIERLLPTLGHRPWLLADPADLSQRAPADVREFASLLSASQRAGCRVVLCCNAAEAHSVASSLDLATPDADEPERLGRAARALRTELAIERVVVHARVGAADHEHCARAEPVDRPARTVGAGDRFAGAYLGALLEDDPAPARAATEASVRFVRGD